MGGSPMGALPVFTAIQGGQRPSVKATVGANTYMLLSVGEETLGDGDIAGSYKVMKGKKGNFAYVAILSAQTVSIVADAGDPPTVMGKCMQIVTALKGAGEY